MKRIFLLMVMMLMLCQSGFAKYEVKQNVDLSKANYNIAFLEGADRISFQYNTGFSDVTVYENNGLVTALKVPALGDYGSYRVLQVKDTDTNKIFYIIGNNKNSKYSGFGYIVGKNDRLNKWEILLDKKDFYAPYNNQELTIRHGIPVVYSYGGTNENHIYKLYWNAERQKFDFVDGGYSEQAYFNDVYGNDERYLRGYAHMDMEWYIDTHSINDIYNQDQNVVFSVDVISVYRNSDIMNGIKRVTYGIDNRRGRFYKMNNQGNYDVVPPVSAAYGYQMFDSVNLEKICNWRFYGRH